MSIRKKVGLFGVGQTDICIYLASILQNMGYRICVLDNSYEQAMHYCIPRPAEQLPTITYKNIDYEQLVPVVRWQEKDYDYLIIDLGVWPSDEALAACDELYLVMDCAIAQISRYRQLMTRVGIPMSVILRDVCSEAVKAKRILSMLQEENCFVVDSYVLPLCEEDIAGRLMMQYQGYQRLFHLSGNFEKMLVNICRTLADCEAGIIWRSLRRARKGECA